MSSSCGCHRVFFGEPTNRDRLWRIIYDPTLLRWNCPYSFQELVDIFLMPRENELTVPPSVFMRKGNGVDAPWPNVSSSSKLHLKMYQQMCPEKWFYDLTSNPEHRRRTETADGALMTLTTNTRIWCLNCQTRMQTSYIYMRFLFYIILYFIIQICCCTMSRATT